MRSASSKLISEVLELTRRELTNAGMRKRRGDIYTCQLNEEILGWIGLNRAVHWGDGQLGINPVIGVSHQPIENMVAEMMGGKPDEYISATVSSPLGYLMPENTFLQWLYEEGADNVSEVGRMVYAIKRYGFVFMQANSTLDAIVETMLTSKTVVLHQVAYRLPVAYLLAGKVSLAEEYIHDQLEALGNRDDMAAQHYRRFAQNFSTRLTSQAKQVK